MPVSTGENQISDAPNATVFPVAKAVNFRDHALDR
jgi:hypothetical protein